MGLETNDKSIPFSLSYNALKMFGRQLYSNAWAAISELVANGFDAGAEDVYLYINMINKSKAVIELFDNGSGMSVEDFKTKYVIIGRNRRAENPGDKASGRKGIGKLAALYLSDSYQIITRTEGESSNWSLNVTGMDDNETPRLLRVTSKNSTIVCSETWGSEKFKTGTLIQLRDVNLERLGEAAIEALKHKLSNYFLFGTMERNLKVCIVEKESDKIQFERIEKKIAFDNMSSIRRSSPHINLDTTKNNFVVSFKDKKQQTHSFEEKRIITPFPDKVRSRKDLSKDIPLFGEAVFYGVKKKYELTGWIGIHSTIDKEPAQTNDKRYIKNQFYNPNQIRVYVRNKLANDTILDKLGLVAQYANYIEGEVTFEILDDNDFDDIATANRQEFSIEDDRVNYFLVSCEEYAQRFLRKDKILRQKLLEEEKQLTTKYKHQKKLILLVVSNEI